MLNRANLESLFNCIKKVYTAYRLPKDCTTFESFKTKLKYTGTIDLNAIEKLLKVNIDVFNFYKTNRRFIATIYLTLDGTQFINVPFNGKVKMSLLAGVPKCEQELVVCKIGKTGTVECYNGTNKYFIDIDEYLNYKNTPLTKDKNIAYIEIKKDELEDKYNNILEETELLKTISGGQMDLSRSGYNYRNEAKKCLHYQLQCFEEPEKINLKEEEWINHSFTGGLMFASPCEIKDAKNYDIIGSYASSLSHSKFTFPIKAGEFKKIEVLPDILNYGIYRVEIEKSNDKKIDRLFRFNYSNYYTHFDITTARLLKLKVNLIIDDDDNALLYKEGRANGGMYFGGLMNKLQLLKDKAKAINPKSTIVKEIRSCLWGTLCSRNKIYKTTRKPLVLKEDDDIIDIQQKEGYYSVVVLKKGNHYKYNYGRVGTFLTSATRKRMTSIAYPINDHIFKINTDSLMSDIDLSEYLKCSEKLGEFRLDKEGDVIIKNCHKVEWFNTKY